MDMEYSIKIVIISKKDWEYPERIGNIQKGLGISRKDWKYPRFGNIQEGLGMSKKDWEYPKRSESIHEGLEIAK